MDQIKELAAAIDREKILRARQTPPAEKWANGPRIFDRALTWMRGGIRHQFPGVSEEEVEHIVTQRLAIVRKTEDQPWTAKP